MDGKESAIAKHFVISIKGRNMKSRGAKSTCLLLAIAAMDGVGSSSSWGPSFLFDDDGRETMEQAKLDRWSRGEFDFDRYSQQVYPIRGGPISYVRREVLAHRNDPHCDMNGFCRIRGGGQEAAVDYEKHTAHKIHELGLRFGTEFLEAIEKNKEEHAEDCKKSCEIYYCADPSKPIVPFDTLMGETSIKSYSMGPVPPEDFAESFG